MSELTDRVRAKIEAIAKAGDDVVRRRAIAAAADVAVEEITNLEDTISDQADDLEILRTQAEGKNSEIAEAVNKLLDEIDRPVGTMHFNVPSTGPVDRALLGLHDAVGRRL